MSLNRMPLWILMLTVLLVLAGCGGGSGGTTNTNTSSNVTAYGMTYDGNGNTGGSVPIDSTSYEENVLVTVLDNTNNLSRSGYSFVGWNTESDGSGSAFTAGDQIAMGLSDMVLYAQWRANPGYLVSYDGNGADSGSVPVDATAYESGQYVTVRGNPDVLDRNGYSFAGWNTQADGNGSNYVQGNQFVMGSTDLTLYAKWSTNPAYTVTYDGNGSTGGTVPVDSVSYEEGLTVTVLGNTGGLVNPGYSFTGWNTVADGSGNSYVQGGQFTMGAMDVTLYAQWSYRPTYTLTYAAYDFASGSVPVDTMRYEEGQTVTVLGNTGNLVPSDNSKVFLGWTRDATGPYTYYLEGETFNMGAADERLVAAWANAETITVSYDGNGNTSGSVPAPPTVYYSGVWLTAAENTGNLERTGDLFVGWYTVETQASGSSVTSYIYPGDPVMLRKEAPLSQTLTLHARWVPRSSMLYNAGAHTGDFGGLAGANALCESNVHPACGPRTKVRAFLDEGFSSNETIGDIPALMGIDANFPIVSSRDRQISANWAGLTDGIDMTLAAAGVLPANTHWWSGGGISNAADEFFSSHSACVSDSGDPWTTAAVSGVSDYHWGAGGSSSTTDREDWINEITTVVTPLPGGGTHTVNYRLECSEQHYLLCICGE